MFLKIQLHQKITTSTVSLGIQHKDVAGTLDINKYNISYSVNGANTDDGSKIITAKNKLPTDSSDNVVITGLTYPNSTYSFDVYLFNEHDMSNSTITVTGDTRPSNFVSTDVSQNKADTTATSLILNVNSSQDANSLAIKNYIVGYSGNNGANATGATRTLVPGNTVTEAINTNAISLSDLSSNTTYDLSAHLINNVDLSNSTLTGFSGTTRPQDFESGNISQVIGTTTQSTLMLKVVNNQVAGTLNINKYMVDVSGNNGTNATTQTKNKNTCSSITNIYKQ